MKGTQKVPGLAVEPREQAQFLKNEGPGKQGEEEKNSQDSPGYPAGLLEQRAQFARVHVQR
jgi:hypothetical protein